MATTFYAAPDFRLAVNVPSTGSGDDLYFHIASPPASYQWVALGLGSRMAGSLIFVAYTSTTSGQLTISPRISTGYQMPAYSSSAGVKVDVISSSTSGNGGWTADFKCTGCRSWNGGKIDTTSSSANMFYGYGPAGNDLNTNDLSAAISRHPQNPSVFSVNLKEATGPGGVPSPPSGATIPTTADPADPGSTSTPSGTSSSATGVPTLVIFHAIVTLLAFGVVYPLGYLFLRIFEKVWLHAGLQTLALLLTILGAGAGYATSRIYSISPSLASPHQIMGIITLLLALAAWSLGLVAHLLYKKRKAPSPLMTVHRIIGPIVVVLGFITACLGFSFAGLPRAIIPWVIWNIVVVALTAGLLFFFRRRRVRRAAMNSTAAQNFRGGNAENVPLGDMRHKHAQPGQQHGPVEYISVQPK